MKRQSKKQSKDKQPPNPPFPLWTVKKQSSDVVDVMILADFAQASIPLDNIACLCVGEERQLCQQSLALGIQNYISLLYMTFLLHFMSVEIRLPKLAINAGFVNRSSISKSIIFKPTHWEKLSTRFEREFTSTYANEKQPESPPSSPSSFGEQMLPCRCSIIIHCTISPFWNHSQRRMSGCTEIIFLSSPDRKSVV